MKTCKICNCDITNQKSYRGRYCITCDNKRKWKENIKIKIINDIPENHKQCKKCNTILKNDEFRSGRYTCKPCENKIHKIYYENNTEKKIEKVKKYKSENSEKIKIARRIYAKNKYKNDICYKIEVCIRARLHDALKNRKKGDKTINYLGCSINELKDWLSYNFKDGMTFENHATHWQIDHIIPCASFDFTIEENIHKCFHWSNLAPLESSKNMKKSSKIDNEMIEYYKVQKDKYINSKSTQQE